MSDLAFILLASVFLPLFPASMIFTAVIDNIKPVWLRELLFLLWPVCGLALILVSQIDMAAWLAPLALFTSLLYALRLLTLREVKQWSRFLAISLWSLLWLSLSQQASTALLLAYAVGMTLPLLLLRRLSLGLEQRFGAAYSDLCGSGRRWIHCWPCTPCTWTSMTPGPPRKSAAAWRTAFPVLPLF